MDLLSYIMVENSIGYSQKDIVSYSPCPIISKAWKSTLSNSMKAFYPFNSKAELGFPNLSYSNNILLFIPPMFVISSMESPSNPHIDIKASFTRISDFTTLE